MKNINEEILKMQEFFSSGATLSIKFRIEALKKLKSEIIKNEALIFEALKKDLSKHPFEAYATEVGIVLHEISYILKRLKKWSKPQKVKTPLMHFIAKSYIYHHPYGVALVVSPWNYPFQLTLAPVVGAIAAGNCVAIKPSEYSVHTSKVITDIISNIFDSKFVNVFNGATEVSTKLLEQPLDYIFFTGSVPVGKIIYKSAAEKLIPVTLELGGKSPCIVDETAKVDLAAKRIIWGKFINSGQTCVAPDYLYVHSSVKEQLITSMKKYIQKFYGDQPENHDSFGKIISEQHFERLSKFLVCGKVAIGGRVNVELQKIAPTVLTDITWQDSVMQEEIFGPILPIMEYNDLNEVIKEIKIQPKSLALYLFTTSKENQEKVLNNLSFGGGCINDTVVHLASSYMPFGGVGSSGLGGYHGKASFLSFSHQQSILKKSNMLDINLRYPPYTHSVKTVKRFLK